MLFKEFLKKSRTECSVKLFLVLKIRQTMAWFFIDQILRQIYLLLFQSLNWEKLVKFQCVEKFSVLSFLKAIQQLSTLLTVLNQIKKNVNKSERQKNKNYKKFATFQFWNQTRFFSVSLSRKILNIETHIHPSFKMMKKSGASCGLSFSCPAEIQSALQVATG